MNHLLERPRMLGLVCGAGAVALGLAYLAAAGAPQRYLLVNLAASVLGAALWLALGSRTPAQPRLGGRAVLAFALPLIATALAGVSVEGASRWVFLGPLSVQVSLVVLPAIIVLYARNPDLLGTAAIALAAVALAIQPDRAMTAVLTAGMAAILLTRPARLPAFALAAAAGGFAIAMLQPDALPAVPYVDRILYTAFDVHPAAGAAVLGGCFLILCPALAALSRDGDRPAVLAFGACWAAVIAAAAIGNYPTPLVGYGGSAILGYLLSAALLPPSIRGGASAPYDAPMPQNGLGTETKSVEFSSLR
jgi:cell division protein FtsW (lipid II flippase)